MFAILINAENKQKIMEHQAEISDTTHPIEYDLFANSRADWYYITGYVNSEGAIAPWAAWPEHVFSDLCEYDADKIKTDWDQIVLK